MANTDSADTGRAKVERKAIHGLQDASGEATKKFEDARSITYAMVGNPDDVFEYNYPASPGDGERMLALFGARTLATNTASQLRQDDATEEEQLAAVRERFEMLAAGTWLERAERAGPKIDVAVLARVAVDYAATQGQSKAYDEVLLKLTEDTPTRRKVHAALREQYLKAVGRPADPTAVLGLI